MKLLVGCLGVGSIVVGLAVLSAPEVLQRNAVHTAALCQNRQEAVKIYTWISGHRTLRQYEARELSLAQDFVQFNCQ